MRVWRFTVWDMLGETRIRWEPARHFGRITSSCVCESMPPRKRYFGDSGPLISVSPISAYIIGCNMCRLYCIRSNAYVGPARWLSRYSLHSLEYMACQTRGMVAAKNKFAYGARSRPTSYGPESFHTHIFIGTERIREGERDHRQRGDVGCGGWWLRIGRVECVECLSVSRLYSQFVFNWQRPDDNDAAADDDDNDKGAFRFCIAQSVDCCYFYK